MKTGRGGACAGRLIILLRVLYSCLVTIRDFFAEARCYPVGISAFMQVCCLIGHMVHRVMNVAG